MVKNPLITCFFTTVPLNFKEGDSKFLKLFTNLSTPLQFDGVHPDKETAASPWDPAGGPTELGRGAGFEAEDGGGADVVVGDIQGSAPAQRLLRRGPRLQPWVSGDKVLLVEGIISVALSPSTCP